MKSKYPISKEFFPFSLFAPPMSRRFVLLAQKFMKTPKLLWQDPELDIETRSIPGYQDGEIEVFIISPKALPAPAPVWSIITAAASYLRGTAATTRWLWPMPGKAAARWSMYATV